MTRLMLMSKRAMKTTTVTMHKPMETTLPRGRAKPEPL